MSLKFEIETVDEIFTDCVMMLSSNRYAELLLFVEISVDDRLRSTVSIRSES